jgi:hypothetical protein
MELTAVRPSKGFDEFSNEFLLNVYAQGAERLKKLSPVYVKMNLLSFLLKINGQ